MGFFLGICGPVQCTEEDYNSMRGYIAKVGNQILDELDINQAYFQQELTEKNFDFFDSEKQNHKVHTLTKWHYMSLGIGCFLVFMVSIATIFEIIQMKRYSQVNQLGVDESQSKRHS